jgi:hypothetical protein
MRPFVSSIVRRLTLTDAIARHGFLPAALVALLHVTSLGLMIWSEADAFPKVIFVLTWALLNFVWLALLRRPALSAALSLAIVVVLMLVSRFKYETIWMTASFIDVMVIDRDTVAYLWNIFPQLRVGSIIALLVGIPVAVLLWRVDPLRLRRRWAMLGAVACLAAIVGLSLWKPLHPGDGFNGDSYVSIFVRSGVDSVSIFLEQGFLESDASAVGRLKASQDETCSSSAGRPHIILVHDESSFDIRLAPGIKVPEGYGPHFLSFDGKARKFLVEGAGGPTWYTEYNVQAGLSSRSYGQFQFFVTRIAAGRVERGLARSLRRCGYNTFTIYPTPGGFLNSRAFYKSTGVQTFIDGEGINGGVFEDDKFYFDIGTSMIARERAKGPMFLHIYLTQNHFPYNYPFREHLTPASWRNPGNKMPEVNEYLRRQAMTARDYADFLARLKKEFPGEPFLIVRYGDHQPDFGKQIIDPDIDEKELTRRVLGYDPRYLMTYYAIEGINFRPADLSSALDTLDAPYLPLVIQEAAGVPLDSTFVEQKKILQRCKGLFYACGNGAEARRFNRLLIDAGLIKGM